MVYHSNMRSDSREEITAAFDALDASLDGALGLDFDALNRLLSSLDRAPIR